MEITALNNFYFKAADGHVRIKNQAQIKVEIPPQMISESDSVKIANIASVMQVSTTTVLGSSTLLNSVLGFGMSKVYDMLNSL
jgi:hypothetical protein